MIEKLVSKLNNKFNLFYLIYAGLAVVSDLTYMIYTITLMSKYGNISDGYYVFNFINSLFTLIFSVAFFGLGMYFILKKDEEKLKKLMILMVVACLYGFFYKLVGVFYRWFYEDQDVYYVIGNIFTILYYLAAGVVGLAYISNVFFGRDIFKKVINYGLAALVVIEFGCFVTTFVGVCVGTDTYWCGIFNDLSSIAFFLLILLAVNKFNLFDLEFASKAEVSEVETEDVPEETETQDTEVETEEKAE